MYHKQTEQTFVEILMDKRAGKHFINEIINNFMHNNDLVHRFVLITMVKYTVHYNYHKPTPSPTIHGR